MKKESAVALGVAACLGWLLLAGTLAAWPEVSGFAAGAFKAVVAVALFWAFDRWVLPGDACEEVIERGNVAYAVMLVALALLLSATVATAQPVSSTRPRHVVVALGEVGTVEATGRNDGAKVEAYLSAVGLHRGAPWCGAFVAWVLDRAGANGPLDARGQRVRTGVALGYRAGVGTVDARLVQRGVWRPPEGALVVWRRGTSWQGHVGVVEWWDRRCGYTVEGNTSSGARGSQRDGDGVWRRRRCVEPGAALRIVAFVPVA